MKIKSTDRTLAINGKSVRLTAGILDASRVGTVGGEVANLGNDALRTDIDVLGVASALVGHQIRTDVERELRRVGASARELGVHVSCSPSPLVFTVRSPSASYQ